MPNVKKGLGRGFDSLIPTQLLDEEFDPTQAQDEQLSELRNIPVDKVVANPEQPRRHFDQTALDELTESIKQHGVLQPIVVMPRDGSYEIVAGERRWRASQAAGKTDIPAIVRSYTDQHKLEVALIENLQREDLNPLETATAYLKLHQQFNMTYEEIGKQVGGGRAVSTISNTMRLLSLPKNAKQALVDGQISEGHARQILAIQEADVQDELLSLIISQGWSVRKAEQFVIGYKEGSKSKKRERAAAKTQTETRETKALGQRLNTPVVVKHMAKGGRLIIEFKSDAEFKRITGALLD